MKLLKGLLLVCLIVLGTVAGAGYYVMERLKPAAFAQEEVVFTIPVGTTSTGIANVLEENGLIQDAMLFSYYLKYKGLGSGFQAGTYAMTPGISIQEIIDRLNSGDILPEETIRFTIPEGYTVSQTIKLLSDLGFDKEELTAYMNNPDRFSADPDSGRPTRVSDIPESPFYRAMLEGYLFPETYSLPKEATAEQAIRRMVTELDKKLAGLPEGWEGQLEASGTTFHEMMTIASLVEREVVSDSERALVAGVIYNRLKDGMRLQIDATVQYLFEEQKERLFEKDLQVESPYNTYLNSGLPPGPIASPGLKSIEAALYPKASDYLFYVTKKDGTGEHYFGVTYNEHLRNIERSKQ